ncbi:hypothetical protein BJ508DRAFT_418913 [Ascobolus immersus RN42]|uniref:Uncharacterized protein n=1 Tax=Ascobolus immersus RN42 TaxID=1160509 RepID=A0A3N4HVQ0_ASCIM|nr:hypothetical protein BJ508DRAFT_418913 [Ascobolus immersus RN42]
MHAINAFSAVLAASSLSAPESAQQNTIARRVAVPAIPNTEQLLEAARTIELYFPNINIEDLGKNLTSLSDISTRVDGPKCGQACLQDYIREYPRATGCESGSDWPCLCSSYETISKEIERGSSPRGRVGAAFAGCVVEACGKTSMDWVESTLPIIGQDIKCTELVQAGEANEKTPKPVEGFVEPKLSEEVKKAIGHSASGRSAVVSTKLLAGLVVGLAGLSWLL